MSAGFAGRQARRQRGIAAIEMALIMPILVLLLAFPLFFGRVFWHYTVAQKAAHDAARFLSSVQLTQMRNPAQIGYSVAIANEIVATELAELNPGPYLPVVTIQCNGFACGGLTLPATVTVHVEMLMYDIFFGLVTADEIGEYGLYLSATDTVRYVGK